jgi:hypothetical protein
MTVLDPVTSNLADDASASLCFSGRAQNKSYAEG